MKVILTDLAKKSYDRNILYLEDNWKITVVQEFILEVERTFNIISENPFCFQNWKYDSSFKKVLSTNE